MKPSSLCLPVLVLASLCLAAHAETSLATKAQGVEGSTALQTGIYQSPLPSGVIIPQGGFLFSNDGECYLVPQADGNLVLYSVALVSKYGQSALSAFWDSGTYLSSIQGKPGSYILSMQDDCNLVLYDGNVPPYSAANAVFNTATYGATGPCSTVVSGPNGQCSFAVLDAAGKTLFQAPTPLPAPPATITVPATTAAPATTGPPASTTPPLPPVGPLTTVANGDCLPLTGDPTTGVVFSNVSCPVNSCIGSISAQQFNYGGVPTFGGFNITCVSVQDGSTTQLVYNAGAVAYPGVATQVLTSGGTCIKALSADVAFAPGQAPKYVSTLTDQSGGPASTTIGYTPGEAPFGDLTVKSLGGFKCGADSYVAGVGGRGALILDELCFICQFQTFG